MGLRLMVYDATCSGPPVGLSDAWRTGGILYKGLDRLDAVKGVRTWEEGLDWLAAAGDEPIDEIQFWGHGNWGNVRVDGEPLDADALGEAHRHRRRLDAVAERLHPESLWWFRTCETFGSALGHDFARRWTDHFGCRAAGHTFIIGFWQSGLHSLKPGERPTWSPSEGLAQGTPGAPEKARWSRAWLPNTISCLRGVIPVGM